MPAYDTYSLCPVCLKRVPAVYLQQSGEIRLLKKCPDHGSFSTVVWRGSPDWPAWCAAAEKGEDNPQCPASCGLCNYHLRNTCCAILNVTERCNLKCNYCFAGDLSGEEPSLEYIKHCLRDLASQGVTFIHLSGGEPTLRDDIPEIVEYAVSLGFEYIQLNTNGLRLAQDESYANQLAAAGLSTVFLQFDGTDDKIYTTLRGRPLFAEKCRIIEHCNHARLGVVLVPTLVPGVNDHNIGELIFFGMNNIPAVKGIHFQPVTYVGRFPAAPDNSARLTLPEVLAAMEKQSGGLVRAAQFSPSCCDHPMCGFHAEYIYEDNLLKPFLRPASTDNCCSPPAPVSAAAAVKKSQNYVRLRWTRPGENCFSDPDSPIDAFLNNVRTNGFSISGMLFQDEYNVDLNRLKHCSVHTYADGKLIPFCANNIYHHHLPGGVQKK